MRAVVLALLLEFAMSCAPRRLRLVALTAVIGTALALGVSASPASADPPTAPQLLTQSGASTYRSLISQLDTDLYSPAFTSVFNDGNQDTDLNRQMTSCSAGNAWVLKNVDPSVSNAWCFQSGDETTQEWVPQGVTGISDGQEDETWGSATQKPIIVTWYNTGDKGVRVSIIDPATHQYRHALLVVPWLNTANHASYKAVQVHAGGIAWYGRYLYVPDTRYGIRVFDLEHVFDLNPVGDAHRTQTADTDADTDDQTQIGRHNNIYYGYGYRYLIPQTSTWSQPTAATASETCTTGSDTSGMRFSYLAVNRGGLDTLVAGEYCDGSSNTNGRLALYPLGALHGATIAGTTGAYVEPSSEYFLPAQKVQGVAHVGSYWYFSTSNGCSPSSLLNRTLVSGGWSGTGSKLVAAGSEDLYAMRGQGRIFSVTEDAAGHQKCDTTSSYGRVLYSTPEL